MQGRLLERWKMHHKSQTSSSFSTNTCSWNALKTLDQLNKFKVQEHNFFLPPPPKIFQPPRLLNNDCPFIYLLIKMVTIVYFGAFLVCPLKSYIALKELMEKFHPYAAINHKQCNSFQLNTIKIYITKVYVIGLGPIMCNFQNRAQILLQLEKNLIQFI